MKIYFCGCHRVSTSFYKNVTVGLIIKNTIRSCIQGCGLEAARASAALQCSACRRPRAERSGRDASGSLSNQGYIERLHNATRKQSLPTCVIRSKNSWRVRFKENFFPMYVGRGDRPTTAVRPCSDLDEAKRLRRFWSRGQWQRSVRSIGCCSEPRFATSRHRDRSNRTCRLQHNMDAHGNQRQAFEHLRRRCLRTFSGCRS